MGSLDSIVTLVAVFFAVKYVLPSFLNAANLPSAPPSDRTPKQKTIRTTPTNDGTKPNAGAGSGTNTGGNWDCITHKERLQVISPNVTVTGTVLGSSTGPHFAPDGDLVFSFKLDPQYKGMVNAQNNGSKYNGGIWVEGVCQKANKATEARHKGDCKCSPTKFPTPKVGQRLKITGAHCKDLGEDGHMEIHPVFSMEPI